MTVTDLAAMAAAAGPSRQRTLIAIANSVPPELKSLALGARINGVVVERGGGGNILIDVGGSRLNLRTSLDLPPGATLALDVETTSPQGRFLIRSMTLPAPAATAEGGGPAKETALSAPTTDAAMRLAQPTDQPAPRRLRATYSPDPQARSASATPQPASTTPSPPPATTAPRHPVTVRIVPEPTAAPVSPPAGAAPAAGALIAGRVVAVQAGTTMVRAPNGILMVTGTLAPPVDGRLTFQVLAVGPPRPSPPATGLSPAQIARDFAWPNLEALAPHLTTSGLTPQTSAIVPSIAGSADDLPAALLLFFLALGDRAPANWLGAATLKTLQGRPASELMTLFDEFEALADTAARSRDEPWTLLSAPLETPSGVRRIRLWLSNRHPPEEGDTGGEQPPADGRRFVIDAEPPGFGPVQLDAFHSRAQARVDVVLRSEAALPEVVEEACQLAFAGGCHASGREGRLTFRSGADAIVEIGGPATTEPERVIVV